MIIKCRMHDDYTTNDKSEDFISEEIDQPVILIVEDNIDIAENITDYLELQGHIMDFAMDGIGGLHLALTQDYDVIILDIMLPGMDGFDVCRKLKANRNT